MKTKMKNIVNTALVAGLILTLSGITIYGQKSFHPASIEFLFNTKTEVTEDHEEVAEIALVELDLYAGSLDFVLEESVDLEDWMLTNTSWNASENLMVVEEEIEISIEDWMTNFTLPENSEMEKEIELETWMYTMDSWK